MQITNPRYVVVQGYPLLELEINGITARIEPPRKLALYEAGLTFVGTQFSSVLPPIDFDGTTLEGVTDDPEVFRLADELGRAANDGTFAEGAIDYP